MNVIRRHGCSTDCNNLLHCNGALAAPFFTTFKAKTMKNVRRQKLKEVRHHGAKTQKRKHLQNIISLRIDDRQRDTLEKLSKATSMSVSNIIREAVKSWSARRRKLCLD